MSNDCSERICQFGLAHVDTPKGDLDASSGELYSPEATSTNAIDGNSRVSKPIIVGDAMYPHGTHEKFPNMVDSTNTVLSNTAHSYMECSNKGICDRSDGTCQCFEGYDGSACQRASCPISNDGVCSGHGTCSTIKDIAGADYNNTYLLWDEHMTMGCICDPGFDGPDCSKKMCKVGADPLYYDDEVNQRIANFTFALWNIDTFADITVANAKSGLSAADLANYQTVRSVLWEGNFSIVFYDAHGEAWHTDPIDIHADCDEITSKVEALPNNVVKKNSVLCAHDDVMYGTYLGDTSVHTTNAGAAGTAPIKAYEGIPDGYPITLPAVYYGTTGAVNTATLFPYTGKKFTLAFPANPGKLRQPELDIYLDGARPTVTNGATTTGFGDASKIKHGNFISTKVRTWVWANGFSGETDDFVPDLCVGVTATLQQSTSAGWGRLLLSDAEKKLLKVCLGDADADPSNNNKVGFTGSAKDVNEALYDWDYGVESESPGDTNTIDGDIILHPHLIKLVDKTATSATRLCTEQDGVFTGVDEIRSTGYCSNPNPAGFYAVLYYDQANGHFNIMSRSYQDYTYLTEFHVFTTTGTLKMASTKTDVFTSYGDINSAAAVGANDTALDRGVRDLTSFYSNVIYTAREDNSGIHNVDCETQSENTGAANVYQCLEKGDYVMIMDVNDGTTNPKYPNIYQIMKISRENRQDMGLEFGSDSHETFRYQIVLDYGVNARYNKVDATTVNGVRIFKFTPPAAPVTWVGQCSQRGICDTSSGLCQCFPGYTSDDCSVMNALAQ